MNVRLAAFGLLSIVAAAAAQSPPRVIELSGIVGSADKGTYQEHQFEVAPGTRRLTFTFNHDHRGAGTELEIGVYDPARFRGTSRFSKTRFHIAEAHATPSYVAGPLPAGTWRVSLGIPTVAQPSAWQVTIRADDTSSEDPFGLPLRTGAAWYVGDLHAHTLHSDAFGCRDQQAHAARGCQAWEVVEAARRAGLDFLAITDHNTTSHHAELAVRQETLADLLLLRGQEVTTFHGHANVYGTSTAVDFRLGFKGRTVLDLFSEVESAEALLSVNHPARETGDRCTGCGWDAPGTDWSRVPAIEIINGTTVEGATAGLPFWYARLNEGHRITAIGGSDDHAAWSERGRIGTPATVIFASELSERALLEGIRTGRVYVRPQGPTGPGIDLDLTSGSRRARMGETLRVDAPATVRLRVVTRDASGQKLEVLRTGQMLNTSEIRTDDEEVTLPVEVSRGDWVHVRLRNAAGLSVISNPIYVR